MKDKEIENLIDAEKKRQKKMVNLIASENYVSDDVLGALGSVLTNKYAEGYPSARYYGGNEIVDRVENLCKERALKLFGLDSGKWAVNVQALSGAPANLAIYAGLLPKGGKIMGMQLSHGGHLSHGHKVSFTGKFWKQIPYTVSADSELLDYGELKKLAMEEKPDIIVAGFTAYPRQVDFVKFREIADACGAFLLADISHIAGLVATGMHPSPFVGEGGQLLADVVMTTTHKTLRGPRSALIFSQKNIATKIDKAVFPGLQGGPHLNQIAGVAVALKEADTLEFKKYIIRVIENAKVLAGELTRLGWRIISGGTDTHLMLVDVWEGGVGISGGEAADRLEKEGIVVNKNTIPFDTRKPTDPSGIRLGTPAETTKGAKVSDMVEFAQAIDKVLRG